MPAFHASSPSLSLSLLNPCPPCFVGLVIQVWEGRGGGLGLGGMDLKGSRHQKTQCNQGATSSKHPQNQTIRRAQIIPTRGFIRTLITKHMPGDTWCTSKRRETHARAIWSQRGEPTAGCLKSIESIKYISKWEAHKKERTGGREWKPTRNIQ